MGTLTLVLRETAPEKEPGDLETYVGGFLKSRASLARRPEWPLQASL